MERRRSVRATSAKPILTNPTGPVRAWFARAFPAGPTPAQALAWPAIAGGEPLLLVAPTGTGKTLAAFLAILDRLFQDHAEGRLTPGLRCVYVSPLRSLGYDIERNLSEPLEAIRRDLGLTSSPVTVGVRTGDTTAGDRRKLRDDPPHLLITTPESLALLLSQSAWHAHWKTVHHLIVDEVHALAPTKRGADLAVSLERLAARADRDPQRLGLSATCRPTDPLARFLVGPSRSCRVIEAPDVGPGSPPLSPREGTGASDEGQRAPTDGQAADPHPNPLPAGPHLVLDVESLQRPDEAPHRGLIYRRLLKRLNVEIPRHRTTVLFANTRAFTEKLTHDLRRTLDGVAAHHSALDAARRREVEAALTAGQLRAVVTSTSLELGVDIGSADLTVMVGLPGSAARCLQRVGRSGHRPGTRSRGLLLAASAAELAGAIVTADAAREGRVEPLRTIANPLDVLCQQLIGMACGDDWDADAAYDLTRKSSPFADLARADFDACLSFLAGELAAPAGSFEPEPGAAPRSTAPRLWKARGAFGVRSRRVIRWYWGNVGTINAEESARVVADGIDVGTLEGAYAERLQPGDCFLLDGRALEFRRREGWVVHARAAGGEAELPRWSSDRQSLSAELARDLAAFRDQAARLASDGPSALRAWLVEAHGLGPDASALLEDLIEDQQRVSEVPRGDVLLIEESPQEDGFSYAFHAPLGRAACEALGRAVAARLGRRFGRDLGLAVADLGWSLRLPVEARLAAEDLPELLDADHFHDDVLDGLDRGELLARRFRHVACTGMMVLRHPDGGRVKVGGLHWVSRRLYPLVVAACPDHPLLRETRREVLDDLLDAPTALAWLASAPALRLRVLAAPSPFTAAWIDPAGPEPLRFEPPAEALRRLHARLTGGSKTAAS